MDDAGLLFRPAVELAAMVRRRELSPVELTDAALERIDRLDPRLGAFAAVDAEGARRAAREAERRVLDDADAPPFLGVPTAIKDAHLTAGLPTTFGATALAGFVPGVDAEHVGRLRRAGFVFVGKTTMPEFGTVPYTEPLLHGPCRNPWDPARSPGGSSGGAAAAVAAGLVPVADGSDGGGSVRIPASACGLLGLKPARGRISNGPLFGDVYLGIVTPGVIARFTADAAAMLDVIAGYATGDPHWAPPPERPFAEEVRREPGRLRLGLISGTPFTHRPLAPEVVRETESFGRLLESLGHDVEACTLPLEERLERDFTTLWTAGLAATPVPADQLEPFNRALARRGRDTSATQLLQTLAAIQLQSRAIIAATSAFDAVVHPTLTRPPLAVGEFANLDPEAAYDAGAAFVGMTPLANLTGQPAVSLPVGRADDGMPIGVSVLGRPADEATLLRLAAQVEAAVAWPSARPPIS